MKLLLACLATLAVLAVAAPATPRAFIEAPLSMPSRWTDMQVAPESLKEVREVLLYIKDQGSDEIEKLFWERTDPEHKDYAKWLSMEEIHEITASAPEDIAAVKAFLKHHNLNTYTLNKNRDIITVPMSLQKIQEVFGVEYSTFQHDSGRVATATLGPYSVPSRVAPHLRLVTGVMGLPRVSTTGHKISEEQAPAARKLNQYSGFISGYGGGSSSAANPVDQRITPHIIRERYNVPVKTTGTASNNSMAVAEFQGQYMSAADLRTFFDMYVPYSDADTVAKIVGPNQPQQPGTEANLDIQYIMGVAPEIETWFYSMSNFAFYSDISKWLEKLQNTAEIPWVHSISYGSQGNYPSSQFRDAMDTHFQKLGLRGVSIIFASGDSGAGCSGAGSSTTGGNSYGTGGYSYTGYGNSYGGSSGSSTGDNGANVASGGSFTTSSSSSGSSNGGSGSNSGAQDCSQIGSLNPSYPATSVYVTAVGSTRFLSANSGDEGATQAFGSGGGFSHHFAVPSYQKSATADYFKTEANLPTASLYNSTNRGNPDVAALGSEHFQVIVSGAVNPVGGTSCAAPTFAGIIALLNDVQLNAGKATLGFLNTWVYKNPSMFFDVTSGTNYCSGGYYEAEAVDKASSTYHTTTSGGSSSGGSYSSGTCGWSTAPGWDPVSGLGTPQFDKMIKALP